jgi:hypothetical protein
VKEQSMLGTLGYICAIGAWICSIMVGVKAIQRKETVVGILSIICSLVGLVYGWVKANEWGIKNLMLIFTILFALGIVLSAMGRSAM